MFKLHVLNEYYLLVKYVMEAKNISNNDHNSLCCLHHSGLPEEPQEIQSAIDLYSFRLLPVFY